jgi:O-antigen ligase
MTTREPVTVGSPDYPGNPVEGTQPRERTPWLLAFLCLLIGFLPSYSVPPGPLKSNGSPAALIAITLFCLCLIGFAVIRRTSSTQTVRPGVVLILLYFLLNLAVLGVGLSHLGSALVETNKSRAIIGMMITVGVALYTMTRIETARQHTIVLGCLAISLSFACLVAVLQNAMRIDLHLLLQPPGFVLNTTDQGRGAGGDITSERFGSLRAFGTAIHSIELSVMAAAAVPLTIHFARYATNRTVRWIAWLACGVALLAIPASVSRSGLLALFAALLVYIWAFKVRQIVTALVAFAVFVGVEIVAFPTNTHALWQTIVTAGEDPSIADRTADYAKVSQTFHSSPVFGIGPGGSLPSVYGFLDNQWLQAIVQGGSVGLAAMLVLTCGGIFGISAALRRATTPRERDQVYTVGAMLVAILASSFTFDLFSFRQATLTFFVLFGLLWSKFTVSLPESKTARSAVGRGAG